METLIILALVLFIVGVGSTILYDKMKADGKSLRDYLPKVNQGDEEVNAFSKYINSQRKSKPAKTPFQDAQAEILRQRKDVEETIKQIRAQFEQAKKKPTKRKASKKSLVKRIKPGSIKASHYVSSNMLPQETEYETFTVQDLIDMMEGRKPSNSRDQEWAKSFLDTLDIED